MPKKQKPVKPICEVRFDFVDSLDRLCHESLRFYQAVTAVIDTGNVEGEAKKILQERAAAFKAVLVGED